MNDHLLWYATRGAGTVSLLLLTAVSVLGLLSRLRVEGSRWPRFLTSTLHSDVALMSIVFLLIHIVTAIADPFTHLGITAAVVPFGSYYRTLWLGLGVVAMYLVLALIATSLLRHVVGVRVWRGIHWAAYAAWPIAVAHGLGTGTDRTSAWLLAVTALCVVAVVTAGAWRLVAAPRDPLGNERRVAAAQASDEGLR